MLTFLIAGLIPGAAYALLAIGIAIMYRTVGVLNFAQTAIGVFGAFVGVVLADSLPQPYAACIGILAGAGIGLGAGIIIVAWFKDSDIQTKSSVTIVMMLGLLAIGERVFGDHPRAAPRLIPRFDIEIGSVYLSLTTIVSLLFAIGAAIAIDQLQRRTRVGVHLSALSERPKTAELLGIKVRALSLSVWALTGGLATLGITLIMPMRPSNFLVLTLLLLPAMAGALLGLFRNIYLALLGGILVGVLEAAATYFSDLAPYRQALPFLVVLVVLLWSQRKEAWDAAR